MLYKTFHNPSHPLISELPNLFHLRRVTRSFLSIDSLSFSPMRFHTSQYSRCFIPAAKKLWNELPGMIVEAQSCKNLSLVLVPFYWVRTDHSLPYVPHFLKCFCILLIFILVLSNFLLLLGIIVGSYSFQNFFFPYWAVFPAEAIGFLTSSSPSWGLQSGV